MSMTLGHATLVTCLPRSPFMCQGPEHKFGETIRKVVGGLPQGSQIGRGGSQRSGPIRGGPVERESNYLVGVAILAPHVGSWWVSDFL